MTTELGVLPSDWRVDRFDSLFDVQQGKQVSKKNRVGQNQRSFLRTKNVLWNRLDLNDLDEMHFSEADETRLALKPDDLLICEGGDIGRTAIWRGGIANCYYQNHLHRARIRTPEAADAQFVLFWLWYAFEFGNLYFGRGNVTTIPNFSQSKLRELPLAIPPLAEQRKIAGVLSLVQRAMEQQERLIALTTELKKALMHQLFTHGIRGEPQKQTEIGSVPQSWEVADLAGLLEIKHGFAFMGEFFAPDGHYILLTPGHFFEDGGFRDQKDKTKFYAGDFPRSYLLAKGDLLVAMTEQKAGLLGSSIVIPESDRYLHNQRLGLIHKLDDSRLDKLFLYYFFNTADVRKRIAMTSSGSKVRHTSPRKIRELKIALPNVDEQRQIVTILQAADAKVALHGRKYAALSELFRTLLHQLMTGQIRVNELEGPSGTVTVFARPLRRTPEPLPATLTSRPESVRFA
jgi:type I restriction enzyme S subunit